MTKFIKNRNDKNHFVEKTVNQIGYPRWNKAITRQRRDALTRLSASDTSQITYIPLVRDSQNYVNAALVIKTTETDTAFQYICDWQYKNFGFDTGTNGWNARTVFQLFTLLDYHTLGHNQFKIKDSLLFSGNNVSVTLLNTNESAQREARLSSSVECTFYQIVTCTSYNNARTTSLASPCSVSYQNFCTTIWSYVPDEGGGGGGGGGGDGETPPPCNTGNVARIQQGTVPPCEPGWEPLPSNNNAPEDPCVTAKNAARQMDSIYFMSKADSVLASIPNLATEIKEKGFAVIKKLKINPLDITDTTIAGYTCTPISTGTDSSITISYTLGVLQYTAAALHTHPPIGYAAHSTKDIYDFLEGRIGEEAHFKGTFVAAFNGSQYALTITNPTQAANFLATKNQFLNGTKWNEDSEIGKAFKNASDYFEKKFKDDPNQTHLAYEMAMATVLTQYGAGLTLNKKDAAGNFMPIIVLTKPDPKKPKRTIYTQECL